MTSNRTVVGVDLGGTKALVAAVRGGEILTSKLHKVHGLNGDELIEAMVETIRVVIADSDAVEAVGLGIPSLLDEQSGMTTSAVNIPLQNVPIRDIVQDQIGLPVAIENDANCAALAESRLGSGQDAKMLVCLTVGTGVGSGVVENGKVVRGSKGYATEIGHMVIDMNGPPCQGNCPNSGCLETMASGTALERISGGINGEQVLARAREGDSEMIDALAQLGRNLGVGIASIINIFNPDLVAIGGGVSNAKELLIEPAIDEAARRALPSAFVAARIELAQLGPEAGVVGAALVAEGVLS